MAVVNATFPLLQARNLNGRTLTLPTDLGGRYAILLIAFQRWHQDLVDGWFPFLDRLLASYPELRAYELPMIGGAYSLARPFIDGGMAASIGDPAVRERTLTIYTDVRRAMAALGIRSNGTITLLLVDRSGTIFWREEGAYRAEAAASLEQSCAALLFNPA